MAFSPNTSTSYNARSISLPSRPHPQVPQFKERLCLLKCSYSTSASTSASSLIHSLGGLKDLYDCLDELLLLQPNQQSLVRFDDHLDASLRLLDVCGSARDSLLQMKECIHSVQSLLRRRGSGGESSISHGVDQYVSLRKKIRLSVKESLKDIKIVLERCSSDGESSGGSFSLVGILREIEGLTSNMFESLLSYITSSKDQAKKSKWFVVSKLLQHSRGLASTSGFDELDVTMTLFLSHNRKGDIKVEEEEKLRNKMVNMEAEIQELEEMLECIFRRLVKTRAILLNILSA